MDQKGKGIYVLKMTNIPTNIPEGLAGSNWEVYCIVFRKLSEVNFNSFFHTSYGEKVEIES